MSVNMREGMLYWTRGGAVVGPFRKDERLDKWRLMGDLSMTRLKDGRVSMGFESDSDLVAEYGPCKPSLRWQRHPIALKDGDFVELRNGTIVGPIREDGNYTNRTTHPRDVIWSGTASELAKRLKAREA